MPLLSRNQKEISVELTDIELKKAMEYTLTNSWCSCSNPGMLIMAFYREGPAPLVDLFSPVSGLSPVSNLGERIDPFSLLGATDFPFPCL